MPKIYIPLVNREDPDPFGLQKGLSIILTSGWQHRTNGYPNGLLMKAADRKARDMAARMYFSHTSPDGVSANANVRSTGYILPDWYPARDNNVESIRLGPCDPVDAINAWLSSPAHKTHLTGGDAFYAGQSAVGLGCAKRSDGACVWVFISAPSVGG